MLWTDNCRRWSERERKEQEEHKTCELKLGNDVMSKKGKSYCGSEGYIENTWGVHFQTSQKSAVKRNNQFGNLLLWLRLWHALIKHVGKVATREVDNLNHFEGACRHHRYDVHHTTIQPFQGTSSSTVAEAPPGTHRCTA